MKEFQIEIRENRPVFRIVAEPGTDREEFRGRLANWWGDAVEVEFIETADLILKGWRSKFRHVISPVAGG